MKTLKLYLVNTKLFKKISICFCSLLMVFASVFCPYSEVKALVGVDDAFYAYAFVTALGVLGIGLASSDASRDAVVDVGTKAYNSFKKYVPMIGQAAVTNVTNFFNFCKDTGKIALDKLDSIKGDIAKWFNSTIAESVLGSQIMSNMGNLNLNIDYEFSKTPFGHMGSIGSIHPDLYVPSLGVAFGAATYKAFPVITLSTDNRYYLQYRAINYSDNCLSFSSYNLYTINPDKTTNRIIDNIFYFDNGMSLVTEYLCLYNDATHFLAVMNKGHMTILNQGTLELDPPKKVTDSFKLDDRVLGLDNVLDLTDTIVGAVGSLTLDKTKDVTTTLGTLDIPDTAIDFPYTGTWDNTLGKIGAIAWNPDIDVPIADTKIIAPTVTPDGKPNTDKKVDDFDGEGGQLTFDWKNVFPFCIPFDLITFIKCLCAEPEAPKMDIPFNVSIVNYKGSVSIDLSKYDSIAKLCRTLMDLLFILGLAYGTRELIKG